MSSLGFRMIATGKLFNLNAEKHIKSAFEIAITKMAQVTEQRTKKQLYKTHGVVTGHLRRSISGEYLGKMKAQVDAGLARQGANVVYANWVEGVSSRNKRTRFKGYKMFQNSKEQLASENLDKYFAKPIKDAID